MLNKKLRVSKELFNDAFKKSKTLSSTHLLLRVFHGAGDFPSKFSFAVPKTVSKKAVTRNLVKRRGYSIIRKNIRKLKKSHICLFSFKKGADKATFMETNEEVVNLLKKAKILDF